jgi:hypothetical protein
MLSKRILSLSVQVNLVVVILHVVLLGFLYFPLNKVISVLSVGVVILCVWWFLFRNKAWKEAETINHSQESIVVTWLFICFGLIIYVSSTFLMDAIYDLRPASGEYLFAVIQSLGMLTFFVSLVGVFLNFLSTRQKGR